MNNITYNIIEPPSSKDNSPNNKDKWYNVPLVHKTIIPSLIDEDDLTIIDSNDDSLNELCAREMDYELNYTIKYLVAILEYYGFKKGKMKKKDIITKIAYFESDPENILAVQNRNRLFTNFIELKNDPFFKKLILKGFA